MSSAVLDRMIGTYMRTQQPVYSFGWQGGEPTLMGRSFFRTVTELQERYGRPGSTVANGLQTNATLITDELAAHLKQYNFLLGVSLDGPAEIHDTYRVHTSGRGSHADVLRGIETLRRHGVEFNVLTLVNNENVVRPRETYRYLKDLGIMYHQYIPCVEFDENGNLLPFAITGEQWGDFLNGVFDEWTAGDTETVSIRHFDSVLTMLVDGYANACYLARNCRQYFVVEFNGDVYPCDFFVQREKRLGNIMSDDWDILWAASKYRDFGHMKHKWNDDCARCPYLKLCSGDCLKHRFAHDENPSNLSALCEGWKKFYAHTLPEFEALAKKIPELRQNELRRRTAAEAQNG